MTFRLIQGTATGPRRGQWRSSRGTVETPAFMPVATRGLMRGPWHQQLAPMGVEMMLANAFHLASRPGVETIKALGGVHGMMGWQGPVLTDSGGFQAFSLADQTQFTPKGFRMRDPVKGHWLDWTPAHAFEVQKELGPDIAMLLDVCPALPKQKETCANAVATTLQWAKIQHDLHQQRGGSESGQSQFAIVQGGIFPQLREECAKSLVDLGFDGFAIGGVSVGEGFEAMMAGVDYSTPHLPTEQIRYLMGVGTPRDLVESVARGVDLFDCVWPTRAGRFATALTVNGKLNLLNARFKEDADVIDPGCPCDACASGIPRGTLRAGFQAKELLPSMMVAQHNLYFIQNLMQRIRTSIEGGNFEELRLGIRRVYPLDSDKG